MNGRLNISYITTRRNKRIGSFSPYILLVIPIIVGGLILQCNEIRYLNKDVAYKNILITDYVKSINELNNSNKNLVNDITRLEGKLDNLRKEVNGILKD